MINPLMDKLSKIQSKITAKIKPSDPSSLASTELEDDNDSGESIDTSASSLPSLSTTTPSEQKAKDKKAAKKAKKKARKIYIERRLQPITDSITDIKDEHEKLRVALPKLSLTGKQGQANEARQTLDKFKRIENILNNYKGNLKAQLEAQTKGKK